VPWYSGAVHCTVWFGHVHGRSCFFIEPHSHDRFFNRARYFGSHDDSARFAFFSKAAREFLLKSNKRPDVIDCHDWQTGLVPVLLYEIHQHNGMHDRRSATQSTTLVIRASPAFDRQRVVGVRAREGVELS
jgi:starch synthase